MAVKTDIKKREGVMGQGELPTFIIAALLQQMYSVHMPFPAFEIVSSVVCIALYITCCYANGCQEHTSFF
jgi:hypothetical protein